MGYKKNARNYSVNTVSEAKSLVSYWLNENNLHAESVFGLPEIDDRYHIWRVPLLRKGDKHRVGEVVVDAVTTLIDQHKSTKPKVIKSRLNGARKITSPKVKREDYEVSTMPNTIALGDAEIILKKLPANGVDLIFTSPPYFNVRPEYSDYVNYQHYLLKMRKIIQQSHRILNEGRFYVMNTSPILMRRASRSQSSKRIAVPFDLHRIFVEEGFEFVDDIIWVKPEGAGWATGRGRRFAADRNPLQYKPVPVTEYVMVYRKSSDKLIDWNIRAYPDQKIVKASKIADGYDVTNIWKITPTWDKKHPAIFPVKLAEKVIKYYSFKTDVVLDPFAGIGTVGHAAVKLGRRFVLIDIEKMYINEIKKRARGWLGKEAKDILCIGSPQIDSGDMLL
ncbi:site-specific DNA-methyltransferase [Candidatus Saccharibacteria bacterium]|nr:site-specific DNA-methyltransferase [Candidatus Saccharibacteria bacterium]